jgi:hypothetical protein
MLYSRKLFLLWLVATAAPEVYAYSIWGHATDDSVCDLGPRTTERIAQHQLIPAHSPNEFTIYRRLIAKRVIDNCKNGQVLLLHTDDSTNMEESILPEVSKQFCTASKVSRTNLPSVEGISGTQQIGFELKCVIAKYQEATEAYLASESKISTDSMLQAAYQFSDQKNEKKDAATNSELTKPDCSKITMATVFFGGSGDCK